ncbi:MAG: WbqC family protein, partial [Planctomycetota bacterium]
GFFDKMRKSDSFVIRDEVQLIERDFHHRNIIRIQSNNGDLQWKWIRVPVQKEFKQICDIEIKNDVKDKNVPWNVFLLRQIKSNYQKTHHFKKYFPKFEEIMLIYKEKLSELNMEIIYFLKDCFGIDTEIVLASELSFDKTGDPSTDLVRIAKTVGADTYLSGTGARSYLNPMPFQKMGVELKFQDFDHPVYPQRYNGFVPNLSAIDALFNVGNVFNGDLEKVSTRSTNIKLLNNFRPRGAEISSNAKEAV